MYGNGDETYYDTYMNVPRMVDLLLERAGSRRFYARGETGEPHAPSGSSATNASEWSSSMWKAMVESPGPDGVPVAWDAHWEGSKPNHHDKYTDWTIKKLQKKYGEPSSVSVFGTPAARM